MFHCKEVAKSVVNVLRRRSRTHSALPIFRTLVVVA
jgi:hypothetical protein